MDIPEVSQYVDELLSYWQTPREQRDGRRLQECWRDLIEKVGVSKAYTRVIFHPRFDEIRLVLGYSLAV